MMLNHGLAYLRPRGPKRNRQPVISYQRSVKFRNRLSQPSAIAPSRNGLQYPMANFQKRLNPRRWARMRHHPVNGISQRRFNQAMWCERISIRLKNGVDLMNSEAMG